MSVTRHVELRSKYPSRYYEKAGQIIMSHENAGDGPESNRDDSGGRVNDGGVGMSDAPLAIAAWHFIDEDDDGAAALARGEASAVRVLIKSASASADGSAWGRARSEHALTLMTAGHASGNGRSSPGVVVVAGPDRASGEHRAGP